MTASTVYVTVASGGRYAAVAQRQDRRCIRWYFGKGRGSTTHRLRLLSNALQSLLLRVFSLISRVRPRQLPIGGRRSHRHHLGRRRFRDSSASTSTIVIETRFRKICQGNNSNDRCSSRWRASSRAVVGRGATAERINVNVRAKSE